jgi:hypothetical protein
MSATAGTLPPSLAASRPTTVPSHLAEADDEGQSEQQPPMVASRRCPGSSPTDADQHDHEEEEHQDRAGVDDVCREEERRVEHGVEDGRLIITTASSSACTALRREEDAEAATTMIGARIRTSRRITHHGLVPIAGRRRGRTRRGSRRPRRRRAHRVRRLLHAGQQRGGQVGLLVDQVGTVVVGELYSLVMVSARVGQASMHRPHRMQRR